jgi:hypothetical protein
VSSVKFHTPIPDGRTGPFMRKPHKKDGFVLVYDARCPKCVADKEEAARGKMRDLW